ncbi:hypothetical protein RB195_013748 [Necator americanus]|uniref:Uncharacterized protein n=1 Tax=Necator americanus TaxID=51031 RepID=A0ABR1DXL2_NECAM
MQCHVVNHSAKSINTLLGIELNDRSASRMTRSKNLKGNRRQVTSLFYCRQANELKPFAADQWPTYILPCSHHLRTETRKTSWISPRDEDCKS